MSKRPTIQPWIRNAVTETVFILLPPFFSVLIVILFPAVFQQRGGITDTWWILLILLVDVAHVYSTLYRTYFDPAAYKEHKNKLLLIPFASFVTLVLLYSQSVHWFWRIMAYAAAYHFIRQQYGFMRIYSRRETPNKYYRVIDALTIYAATIYPLLYWHLHSDRNFNWFVEGDFFNLSGIRYLSQVCTMLYILILCVYLVKECTWVYQSRRFNIPRNAVILGTIVSWYLGIVYFNGDLAFTLLNVVSHGVPYMALIWLYGKRTTAQPEANSGRIMKLAFSKYGILVFLGLIFVLAFVEEGLWDMTLWKEHANIFRMFDLGKVHLDQDILKLIVPLLALPQVTHYIIDGFIWRIRKNDLKWSEK